MIYQAVTDSAISDEEFSLISNEAQKYIRLKQDIIMMKSEKSDNKWELMKLLKKMKEELITTSKI